MALKIESESSKNPVCSKITSAKKRVKRLSRKTFSENQRTKVLIRSKGSRRVFQNPSSRKLCKKTSLYISSQKDSSCTWKHWKKSSQNQPKLSFERSCLMEVLKEKEVPLQECFHKIGITWRMKSLSASLPHHLLFSSSVSINCGEFNCGQRWVQLWSISSADTKKENLLWVSKESTLSTEWMKRRMKVLEWKGSLNDWSCFSRRESADSSRHCETLNLGVIL